MTDIIARRQFAPLYIWLDIAFLCVFLALLLMKKKYMTVLVGLVMGVVYMLVDYGISTSSATRALSPKGTACSSFCCGCRSATGSRISRGYGCGCQRTSTCSSGRC